MIHLLEQRVSMPESSTEYEMHKIYDD